MSTTFSYIGPASRVHFNRELRWPLQAQISATPCPYELNLTFPALILGKEGHQVDVAENGLEAVDAVKKSDYDLILMDVQMPQLDGIQAAKQIRNLLPPKKLVPIIALTADAMTGKGCLYRSRDGRLHLQVHQR